MTDLLELPAASTRFHMQATPDTSGLGAEGLASERETGADGWSDSIRQAEALSQLKDDWDGEGAVAPSRGLVASAVELLQILKRERFPCPSGVGAGPNGTVLVDWQNGRRYFEIDVVAPYKAEWMRCEPGLPTVGGKILGEIGSDVLAALDRVTAG